jgi:peptide/nickel transport system substrate-binding protein
MRSRGILASLAVLVTMTASVTACSTSSAGATARELRVGTLKTADSLNPFVEVSDTSALAMGATYPHLVGLTAANRFIPGLAASWTISDSGRTYTFHLHPGARWSDGRPMTAADAAWTINTVIKFAAGPTANQALDVSHVSSAQAVSSTTLVVHLKSVYAGQLLSFSDFPILPQHIWARYAAGNGKALSTFANPAPTVGGGPFTVSHFQKDQALQLKANPHYYGPKPHVQYITFEFFSDSDAMILALKHDQVDAVTDVPPTAVSALHTKGIDVLRYPGIAEMIVSINVYPKRQVHQELRNPRVREAFDYAVDRARIVKVAFEGAAAPGSSLVPSALGFWHDPRPPTPFDLAKANQLLDAAGYRRGSNGIRIADGHPMSYKLIVGQGTTGGQQAFSIMQNDFSKIGVRLTEESLDDATAVAAVFGKAGNYSGADMNMFSVDGSSDPTFILGYDTCAALHIYNLAGWCDKPYDAAVTASRTTLSESRRKPLIYRAQAILAAARPQLVLAYAEEIDASTTAWAGWQDSSQGLFNSLDVATFTSPHRVS